MNFYLPYFTANATNIEVDRVPIFILYVLIYNLDIQLCTFGLYDE